MARTRAEETRAASARPLMGRRDGELNVDTSSLPSNVVPKWIRETCRGEYDDHNVQRAMEDGFKPVLASELRGFTTHRLPGARGSEHQDDELVRRGGMVLMVRDRDLDRQERAALHQETLSDIRSVARDSGAPKDGHNFQDMKPEVSINDQPASRFSE